MTEEEHLRKMKALAEEYQAQVRAEVALERERCAKIAFANAGCECGTGEWVAKQIRK